MAPDVSPSQKALAAAAFCAWATWTRLAAARQSTAEGPTPVDGGTQPLDFHILSKDNMSSCLREVVRQPWSAEERERLIREFGCRES